MNIQIMGWAEFTQGNLAAQIRLINWKVNRYKLVGWYGVSERRYGGGANPNIPLNDWRLPIGCLAIVDGTPAGCAFLGHKDFCNYPVEGQLKEPFTDLVPVNGEIADPWLVGLYVDQPYRKLGIARRIESWLIQQAVLMAERGLWSYSRRRLWLSTERKQLTFLPEMYERWGWTVHRNFMHYDMHRWVMYKDF